jgi:hypothetical protein
MRLRSPWLGVWSITFKLKVSPTPGAGFCSLRLGVNLLAEVSHEKKLAVDSRGFPITYYCMSRFSPSSASLRRAERGFPGTRADKLYESRHHGTVLVDHGTP